MASIALEKVSKVYPNGFEAVHELDLAVEDGEFMVIVGPSGCGKTTLLRIANGLVEPSEGEVRIDGRLVDGPAADRAMVFQEFNLLPWRTARGNVAFPLEVQGVPKAERLRRADAALQQVGLDRFLGFFPHQLSGGMKQRVGLARALGVGPAYLFMDEPFGALDPQIREVMQIELLKLWDGDRKTVVFVTHSVDEAVFLSDRVVMFGGSPGRIIADIAIDLPRPRWRDDEAIKASAPFIRYRHDIWHLLKQQLGRSSEADPA
jgi:NitT/TauT family transport system ATP-binding protein